MVGFGIKIMSFFNKIIKKVGLLWHCRRNNYPENVKSCLLYAVENFHFDIWGENSELEIAINAVHNRNVADLYLLGTDIDFLIGRIPDSYRVANPSVIVKTLIDAVSDLPDRVEISKSRLDSEIARVNFSDDMAWLSYYIKGIFLLAKDDTISHDSFLTCFKALDFNYRTNFKGKVAIMYMLDSTNLQEFNGIFTSKNIHDDLMIEKFSFYDISKCDEYQNNIMKYLLLIPDAALFKKILDVLVKNGLDLHHKNRYGNTSVLDGLKGLDIDFIHDFDEQNIVVDKVLALQQAGFNINFKTKSKESMLEYIAIKNPSIMSILESRLISESLDSLNKPDSDGLILDSQKSKPSVLPGSSKKSKKI